MSEVSSRKLAEVTQCLLAAEIPWGVFAGAAACAYGSSRPIQDIDILIPSDAGERAAAFFPQAQQERDPDGRLAMLTLPGFEIIAGLNQRICLEMDAEMIARLEWRKLLDLRVSLLSLEDNLVYKAVLGRGPEVGKHDWADIAEMLACSGSPDWDYLQWRLRGCAPDRVGEIIPRLKSLVVG